MKQLAHHVAALVVSVTAIAQKKISIEDFTTKNTFDQKSVAGIRWMK